MSFPRFYYSFIRPETIDKTYEQHQVRHFRRFMLQIGFACGY